MDLIKSCFQDMKAYYGKFLTFAFCLAVVSFLIVISQNTIIFPILLLVLIFFPLLCSFQILMVETSIGKQSTYKDLYRRSRLYFMPHFTGCYGVLLLLVFTFLLGTLLNGVLMSIDMMTQPELLNELMDYYVALDPIDFNTYFIENITTYVPHYDILSLIAPAIFIAVFYFFLHRRLLIPFLTVVTQLPALATKKIMRTLKQKAKSSFRVYRLTGLFLFLLFSLGVGLGIGITLSFQNAILSLSISLLLGIFLAALFFPLYMRVGYETALSLRPAMNEILKQDLLSAIRLQQQKTGEENAVVLQQLESMLKKLEEKDMESESEDTDHFDDLTKE